MLTAIKPPRGRSANAKLSIELSIEKIKKSCSNLEANLAQCTCSYSGCEKQGLCCQCVAYHRKMRQIPGCFFSAEAERTYDRSYTKFRSDCC